MQRNLVCSRQEQVRECEQVKIQKAEIPSREESMAVENLCRKRGRNL